MTHISVRKQTIIGSGNGLSPGRRQAIIWTNAAILLIGTIGTNFSEILIEIHQFSFKKMHLKMSSGKQRSFCLSLNVLMAQHETAWSPLLRPVFDFSAGPLARGRQLYCRACNFKNMSALLASKFYTSYAEPNGLQLFMDTGTTRFYSKARHLVMIQTNTRQRCVPSKLEISKLYQLFPWGKYEFCHTHSDDPFLHLSGFTWWITWMFPQTWLQ